MSARPRFLADFSSHRGEPTRRRQRGVPGIRQSRPRLELLEERLAPATFAVSGSTLDLVLGTSEKVAIVSSTTSYTLSLGADQTWTGTNSADVTGNGLQSLTITSAGITAFSTGIDITDSTSTGGDAVAFNDSTTNPYANNFIITLNNSSSGASTPGLSFTGASTFSGTSALTASVNGDVVVNSGASLALGGGALSLMATGTNAPLTVSGNVSNANGPITLQATGDVTVGSGVMVNSGTAALSLAADVKADGSGDDGVGTLSVGAGAGLYGASIALRGADVDIDSTANVGSASSQPVISTFVPASAGLSEPIGLAFDTSGNLYVANLGNNTISKVTPGGTVSTFVPASAGLSGPLSLAFDASGNLYVGNDDTGTINEVTPSGAVSTFVPASARLSRPSCLAFDSSGNLYVGCQGTSTISKVTPDGTVSTFVPASAGLSDPNGLAFDASGNLYIANTVNGTISKVTPGGTVSTLVSGLSEPAGLAFDASGNLDVANLSGTVSKVAPGGTVSTLVSGLSEPWGLAFDASGNLYIANTGNGTISKLGAALPATIQVTIQSSLPSLPMSLGGTSSVTGINLTSAELARIVTAPTGTVTIGDSSQTGDITFSGATVATTAGATTNVVQSTTGAGQIVLDDSNGTALDGNGGSISLTAGTGGIAALNPANATAEIATTGASVTLNTTGPIGTASNPIQFADNTNTAQQVVAIGSASTAYLDGLGSLTLGGDMGGTANTALTVTARTNLVVADNATINTGTAALSLAADVNADGSGNDGVGILSIDAGASLYGASITLRGADIDIDSTANVGSASSQSPVTTFVPATAGLSYPYYMAFDASGNLYVANYDGNTISKVTPSGTVSTFVSSGLSEPVGLAFDASGNLYVANYESGTISKVTPAGTVSTFVSLGAEDRPSALAFDSTGNLYVSNDFINYTISKVTPGGTVSTFVSSGLDEPYGLAFDASGNLYVANAGNHTISKVTSGGTVSTFVSSGLSNPWGLAFDASGNLDVANLSGTVSKVTPGGIVSTLVSGLSEPVGLAFDSSGALYISNLENTISKVAALPATTQVTIRSSLPGRPMSLGGSNNAAVDGINLTSAELARIVTAPTGTVTIGDSTQTGDITFSGATVATTAGAATTVVQSTTGAGQIVLDDSNGTALDGNGGSISLTAGTGGIAALNPANATAEIATTGAGVTLNTTGPIGTASNPIQFADNTNTAQQVVAIGAASSAYLDGLGSLTLGGVTGGTSNTALTVTARTNLVVADNATINTGTAALSLGADLQADGAGDDGVGTLSIDAGTSLYGASITLRGADIDIASTANVGSASAQSPIPATTQVTIQSSLPTLPISLGSTGSETGINLTSAELARIVTTSTGTVTIGDSTQTGDITFSDATVATTAGAATTVVQSATGAGTIVLDASTGTALDGNGGTVTLTPGTGGLSASVPASSALLATNGFTAAGLTLNLALNAAPTLGQKITLVSDSGSAIDGNFTNLADGNVVTLSYDDTPYQFLVSYEGGDGNDLVLTSVASPTITSADSTTFTVGQAGSFTVTTTGTPTPSLSVTGSLPSGVTFTDNGDGTATLAGTPQASTGGTYSLTFTASNGVGSDAAQSFTLTVNQAPAITSASSTTFTAGAAGSFTITATGFPTPTLSESSSDTLPTGVTFNAATGVLGGTPAAGTGGTYTLTFTASNGVGSDAAQSFTLTVNQAPAITSASSTTFTAGAAGSFTVTATGFPTPTLSESSSDTLPTGVTFNAATGVLGGTPAAGTGGTYTLTFTASNGVGSDAAQSFTLTVNQVPAITSASSTTFTAGAAGSFTITATGFPTPTLSESSSDTLPTGVTFNAATGVLGGTPAAGTGGTYTLTFTASNGVGSDAAQSFTLTVNQAPAITSASSTTFTAGAAGSFTVTATGFPTPTLSESSSDTLPTGVTFNAATGVLGGTPAAGTGGTYTLTFTASNGVGSDAAQSFTLTVNQAPAITSASSTTFTAGAAGSFTITATGFPTPTLSESSSDTLPTGVTFNAATGVLGGTPAAGTGGTYTLTFTASNGVGSDAAQSFTLTVNQAPAITSASSTTFTAGAAGSFTVTATGFPTPTLSESSSDTLPTGVTFNAATGVLGGTPAAGTGGTYTLTFTASNGVGSDAAQSFTLTVNQAPAITSADHTGFAVGQAGSFTITTTGFPAAAITETGALPSGVTLTDNDDGTATLSGNPATGSHGTYPFTITAANGTLPDATQSFTLTVQAATTTTLIASPNPSVFGQTVTFVAQVANTSGTGPVPDGQVQFYDGTTQIGGDVTLDANGTATLSTSDLLPSTQAHSITAQYVGNDNFQPSTSTTQSEIVNPAATTTSLVASANPSVYGQDVTFTVFVTATAPGTGTPDGQAQLYIDSSAVGAPFTLTGGQGSITVAHFNNLIGGHTVQVDYLGSSNYSTSNSGGATQTVDKAALTLAIVPSANPVVYGQTLNVTVSATAAQPGAGVPGGGTVTLQSGTYSAQATLTDGSATFSDIPAPVPGAYTVLATYDATADPHFQGATATIMEAVTKETSSTTLSASANPSAYGTPLTFTATVAADAGAAIPTGTVVFWDGGNAIGSRSIIPGANSGTATLTIASLGAGVHQVWATYSGDPNYKGSESVVDVQTVNPVATTTTLSSALNPSMYGQCVMLTATVQAAGGTIQPTGGTVQFWDGTALLGTASLANSSQASLAISALAAGSHSLTAVLLASANFQTSTSGSIAQQVVKNQTVVQLGCAMAEPTAAPAVRSAAIAAAARVHRQVVFTILVHPAGARPTWPRRERPRSTSRTADSWQRCPCGMAR